MNKRELKELWFREGAPLFRRALEQIELADKLPSENDYYACPSCLIALPFGAIAANALTLEHVPPESLGGKEMLLTCEPCNSKSGANFDSQAKKRAATQDLLMGSYETGPMGATFTVGGTSVRGEVSRVGNSWLLQGVPKQNNPAAIDALKDKLDTASERGEGPSISFALRDRFSPSRANVSYFRSAYFAAFAALGWRYILRPALAPIREQFQNFDEQTFPKLIGDDPNSDDNTRKIMVVESPEDLCSVVVVIGRYSVFLPDPWGTLTCDQLEESITRLRDENGWIRGLDLRGQSAPWPRKPMYLLDKAIK